MFREEIVLQLTKQNGELADINDACKDKNLCNFKNKETKKVGQKRKINKEILETVLIRDLQIVYMCPNS